MIVLAGRLRVARKDREGSLLLYTELYPGECIGETGMILQQPRTADVVALRDSTVAELSRADYETLLQQNPLLRGRDGSLGRLHPVRIGSGALALDKVRRAASRPGDLRCAQHRYLDGWRARTTTPHGAGADLQAAASGSVAPSRHKRANRAVAVAREVERIYLQQQDTPGDHESLARFLTGHATGIVLGGGGARGFAHLGVLRALEEANIPIDLIGGNSMGALIGAQYACGIGFDDIRENILRFTRTGERPSLPVISVLCGRRIERELRRLFGDATADALWRPYFAAACNLSQACTTVQDTGPLWRAVLASNSPAGLLPPVLLNGDLLVDGALLDNVPAEAMRTRLGTKLEKRRDNGTVIAVDVDVREALQVDAEVKRLSPWRNVRRHRTGGPGHGLHDYRPQAFAGRCCLIKSSGLANCDRWLFRPWLRLSQGALATSEIAGMLGSVFEAGHIEALGAAQSFLFGRWLAQEAISRVAGPRVRYISQRLGHRGVLSSIALRLVPVAPFALVNMVAGASTIRLRDFLFGSAIGMLPLVLVSAVFAEQIVNAATRPGWLTLLFVGITLALLVGGSAVLRRWWREAEDLDENGATLAGSRRVAHQAKASSARVVIASTLPRPEIIRYFGALTSPVAAQSL